MTRTIACFLAACLVAAPVSAASYTSVTHLDADNQVTARIGSDRISKNFHDNAGRLIESWDGVGTPLARREAQYSYNANGQKTSLTG